MEVDRGISRVRVGTRPEQVFDSVEILGDSSMALELNLDVTIVRERRPVRTGEMRARAAFREGSIPRRM